MLGCVEIEAAKGFLKKIEINYVDDQLKIKRTKWVKVEYAWNPVLCNHCNIFGHSLSKCVLKPRTDVVNDIANSTKNQCCKTRSTVVKGDQRMNEDDSEEEDVYENIEPVIQSIIADEKELKKFIGDEKLQFIAVLETHLKTKNIFKVRDKVFGSWNWISNLAMSPTSLETIPGKIKTYVSVIYASNNGIERRELSDNLLMNKSVVIDKPWIIMIDFNVTLKPEEHSNGGSGINGDMHEFNDVFNGVEVEDICCLGFQFTWTKSIKNPENFILEKLDRIMINDSFNQKYGSAHGVFLPYLISDHSPIFLVFPEGLPKKHGNLFEKAETLKLSLQDAQKEVNKDPSNMDKKKLAVKILEEYTEVAGDELKLLHQKAKIDWLRDGDKNTSYFHSMLKARKHNNRVESTISLDQLGEIVNLKLSCEDVEAIIVEGIIRKEVCLAVKEFFSNRKLLDDLLMLCNGDTESLKFIKKSLDEFSSVSGLFPNHSKSTIFFGSIMEGKKKELMKIMPFKCGKLPMKYLEVLLFPKD
ncbi:RNA-directed DNA polymerase, eukaryota, reverse transcriptase zinc-binding domain protein [Tanacetum coccineum]|uniref:RNA-directed DNA polymerase, eukaryota, reverse transcriptase zinc-binding domain protein n=1 Tax=Tanacetum coccineum TaxID=301880 RepID=A0ABQ5BBC4_9ASTR